MQITNVTQKLKFNSELAGNLFLQAKGLSFSSRKRNMLFRFKLPNKLVGFWMFGMSYDLWIAFLDDRKMVFDMVHAEKMTLNPKTWKIYRPKKACRYVLETPEKLVDIGDKLTF